VDLYNQTSRRVVVRKASQVGVSEYLVSHALWSADQRSATVLYVFPTDKHVSDFSSARVGPAIEASAYLDAIIVEGGERGADRVTLKRVRTASSICAGRGWIRTAWPRSSNRWTPTC